MAKAQEQAEGLAMDHRVLALADLAAAKVALDKALEVLVDMVTGPEMGMAVTAKADTVTAERLLATARARLALAMAALME